MSLRDQLKRAVASCASIGTQHATFAANDATGNATPAQPQGRQHATGTATPAQHPAETSATLAAPSCATVASELTAQRTMKKLLAAAMRCCDRHGDGAEARAEMERQCLEIPPHLRGDLLDYFNTRYPEQES